MTSLGLFFCKVVLQQEDVELIIPIADKLLQHYGADFFGSISSDKGFYKKSDKELLKLYFDNVIIPKKGKRNLTEQAEESTKKFKKLRNAHSAVESDINSLEHHGLNCCPDKGLEGFKKYAALGVLSYNLHKLGNALTAKEIKEKERKEKRRIWKKAA